jgi:hypothetical protein
VVVVVYHAGCWGDPLGEVAEGALPPQEVITCGRLRQRTGLPKAKHVLVVHVEQHQAHHLPHTSPGQDADDVTKIVATGECGWWTNLSGQAEQLHLFNNATITR